MNRKKELEKIIASAQNELSGLEYAEHIKTNTPIVGKFFKYHNCYSCPKPNEYWWYYVAATGIDEFGDLTGWNFQIDINGKIEVETKEYLPDISDNDGYIEIGAKEFWDAFDALLLKLKDLAQS